MTSGRSPEARRKQPSAGRRAGYIATIVINLFLLAVINNLSSLDVVSWLTADLEALLPIINLSLGANITANVVYIWYDVAWFKGVTQIVLSGISLVVVVRTWRIYPFDFSAYDFNWDAVVRTILVIAAIGISIGIVAEVVKLVRLAVREAEGEPVAAGAADDGISPE